MTVRELIMPLFNEMLGEKKGEDADCYNWEGGRVSSPEGRDDISDFWELLLPYLDIELPVEEKK